MAGLAIFYLPPGWKWIAIIIYIPLAAFLIYHVTVQTIKRDWLYSSLMLMPVPIAAAWFLVVGHDRGLGIDYLRYFGPSIGLSFLIMAISVAFFIRLRQRVLKMAMLLISAFLALTLVLYYAQGRLGLPAFIILLVLILGLFVTPAILEHRIKRNQV